VFVSCALQTAFESFVARLAITSLSDVVGISIAAQTKKTGLIIWNVISIYATCTIDDLRAFNSSYIFTRRTVYI
jgi:hypothetical protein